MKSDSGYYVLLSITFKGTFHAIAVSNKVEDLKALPKLDDKLFNDAGGWIRYRRHGLRTVGKHRAYLILPVSSFFITHKH